MTKIGAANLNKSTVTKNSSSTNIIQPSSVVDKSPTIPQLSAAPTGGATAVKTPGPPTETQVSQAPKTLGQDFRDAAQMSGEGQLIYGMVNQFYTAYNWMVHRDTHDLAGENVGRSGAMDASFFSILGAAGPLLAEANAVVATKSSTKLLGQPIRQGNKQLEWIMAKHGPNQLSKYAGKSQFYISSQAELQTLIQNATHMPMTIQSGGNILRTVNAGRTIGLDAITGKPTSIYSVITNPNGSLITAFPGLP